ncbi:MAG: flagellar hook-associated protein FlgL [Deltaproteobacteria bacterium]|nr:flagellar hook-associated protein FlgL [Deltaproteobacteria bacterium]
MRVANKTIYDIIKFNLGNITEELNRANKVVATGKRITELSDDPVGLTQALNIRSSLSNIEQLGRNISMGRSWLTASESALTQVQNQISDARALCVQMATATTGSAERASAAATVQNTLEEIVSLANTEVNGRYIFAGSKTDAAPFSRDNDTNVVTYNGDNKAFTIKIGRDATVEVGSDGEAVFGDIFTTLSDLKDALEADDVSGIQAAMSNLDTHFDRISTKISEIGSKMLRMETKEKVFQDLNITNTERLSKIEDADITEAIMDLKAKELAYKAALASSARVMQLSLVDYL